MRCYKITLLLSIFLFSSCEKFVSSTDSDYFTLKSKTKDYESIKVVFSHNINAETHPCGCRKFPLGGLVQVSSYLHNIAQKNPVFYVDSGDMLFPSTTIPKTLEKSMIFSADKMREAQENIGLKLFVPGDQDFAAGREYIEKLSESAKFKFLISNLKDDSKIKNNKTHILDIGERKLVFIGISNPSIYNSYSEILEDPKITIKRILASFDDKKNISFILLSHSGMDYDKILAKEFPQISFIIGSHTQAFLKETVKVGETQIAQVLSRNHYLGVIDVPLSSKKEITYSLVAMDDEKKDLWRENPFIDWLQSYKSSLDKIQSDESKAMDHSFGSNEKAPTYASCVECHQAQNDFWQSTAHATSFHTLIKAKASNNNSCIGCHSLKFQDEAGFTSKNNIVRAASDVKLDMKAYWSEVESAFKDVESIRELDPKSRKKLAKQWQKIDTKHKVQYNNANVQCLNCHDKAFDHPFTLNEKPSSKIENSCYKCHTPDQSPLWYKGENGQISERFNDTLLKEKLKQIACPKNL